MNKIKRSKLKKSIILLSFIVGLAFFVCSLFYIAQLHISLFLKITACLLSYVFLFFLCNIETIFFSFMKDKQKEKLLKQNRTKYKVLFESSFDSVILMNKEGFVDCNQAALNMFGVDRKSEFIKRHPSSFSPEFQPNGVSSFELADKYIYEAMKKGFAQFNWAHKKKNGKEFLVEVLLNRIDIEKETMLQANLRDITDQKNFEKSLKNVLKTTETILDGIPFGIVVIGKDRIVRKVNDSALRLLGKKREDILGKVCTDTLCPALDNIVLYGMKIRFLTSLKDSCGQGW